MLVVLDSSDGREHVGYVNSLDEAYDIMNDYLDKANVKPYYYRTWIDKGGVRYVDYGSHTRFFKIFPD